MKNLLTKTLFISLLFSVVAPAIQADETAKKAFELGAKLGVEASTEFGVKAFKFGADTLEAKNEVPSIQKQVDEIPAAIAGFFSTLAAKVSDLKKGAASFIASYLKGAKTGMTGEEQGAKSYVTKGINTAGNWAAKNKTGLRNCAYATAIVAASYCAYKVYKSEAVKNVVKKAKKAWKNKWVRRGTYGIGVTLAIAAGYTGLVCKGKLPISSEQNRNNLSSSPNRWLYWACL